MKNCICGNTFLIPPMNLMGLASHRLLSESELRTVSSDISEANGLCRGITDDSLIPLLSLVDAVSASEHAENNERTINNKAEKAVNFHMNLLSLIHICNYVPSMRTHNNKYCEDFKKQVVLLYQMYCFWCIISLCYCNKVPKNGTTRSCINMNEEEKIFKGELFCPGILSLMLSSYVPTSCVITARPMRTRLRYNQAVIGD